MVWSTLDLCNARGDGPVAVGSDLGPENLMAALRHGVFPWPTCDPAVAAMLEERFGAAVASGKIVNLDPTPPSLDLPWWCPDPRGVIRVGSVHVSRSLRRHLASSRWTSTIDRRFDEVMRHCAREETGRWITPGMTRAYQNLHACGAAHSIEIWSGSRLIGGMYGVVVGGVYCGESMFHLDTGASKAALVDFAERYARAGGVLIETQFSSDHLRSLGGSELSRASYLELLAEVRDRDVLLDPCELGVARLARLPSHRERRCDGSSDSPA